MLVLPKGRLQVVTEVIIAKKKEDSSDEDDEDGEDRDDDNAVSEEDSVHSKSGDSPVESEDVNAMSAKAKENAKKKKKKKKKKAVPKKKQKKNPTAEDITASSRVPQPHQRNGRR
eukprot:scaffold111913_cov49-Attheya_sp.AAC.1